MVLGSICMQTERLVWAALALCAAALGCGDDSESPSADDATDEVGDGLADEAEQDDRVLSDGRSGDGDTGGPCDARYSAFFDFCDPGNCQVPGEQCVEGRCYLPCETDVDCPILTVSASDCTGLVHAGSHEFWVCNEAGTERDCLPGSESGDDSDGDPCVPIYPDGSRSHDIPLVCAPRPDGTLGCLLPSMAERQPDGDAGTDDDAGVGSAAASRLCEDD